MALIVKSLNLSLPVKSVRVNNTTIKNEKLRIIGNAFFVTSIAQSVNGIDTISCLDPAQAGSKLVVYYTLNCNREFNNLTWVVVIR